MGPAILFLAGWSGEQWRVEIAYSARPVEAGTIPRYPFQWEARADAPTAPLAICRACIEALPHLEQLGASVEKPSPRSSITPNVEE